ncbi:hypothetical protein MED121_02100 [Marinomonas sp. MED121]|nr:hypothetical protein MED121_02100 [Marinomonas sp. MED121]
MMFEKIEKLCNSFYLVMSQIFGMCIFILKYIKEHLDLLPTIILFVFLLFILSLFREITMEFLFLGIILPVTFLVFLVNAIKRQIRNNKQG